MTPDDMRQTAIAWDTAQMNGRTFGDTDETAGLKAELWRIGAEIVEAIEAQTAHLHPGVPE